MGIVETLIVLAPLWGILVVWHREPEQA